MTAVRDTADRPGGDPDEDEGDPQVQRVRGALERLAEELEDTSETLDRTIAGVEDDESAGDGPPADS